MKKTHNSYMMKINSNSISSKLILALALLLAPCMTVLSGTRNYVFVDNGLQFETAKYYYGNYEKGEPNRDVFSITTVATHGTVTTDPASEATAGATVTITATPDSGYETSSVTVTTTAKTSYEVTDNGDGTYEFIMPGEAVTVEAEFNPTASIYKKVSKDRSDWSGTYLLAGQHDNNTNPTTTLVYTGSYFINNSNATTSVQVSDGIITNPSGVVELKIEYVTTASSVKYYRISYVSEGTTYYLGNNSSSGSSPVISELSTPPTSNTYLWSIKAFLNQSSNMYDFGSVQIGSKNYSMTYIVHRYTTTYKTFLAYNTQVSGGSSANYNANGYSNPILYEKVYRVNVVNSIVNGTITVDKDYAAAGETVTVTTHPNTGYATTGVSTSPSVTVTGDVTSSYTFTFTMPERDVNVSATFGEGSPSAYHSITCMPSSADPVNGYITASLETAVPGTIISITDVAEEGYKLSSLTAKDAANNNIPVTNRTFVMPGSSVTVTADFCESSSNSEPTIITLGTTPDTITTNAQSFAAFYMGSSGGNAYSELIYSGTQLGSEDMYITSISWYFDIRKKMTQSHYMRMYMKEVSETAFVQTGGTNSSPTSNAYLDGYTLVYEEEISSWNATGRGWHEFRLTQPFKVDAANKSLAVAVFIEGAEETGVLYWSNANSRTKCHRWRSTQHYYIVNSDSPTIQNASLGDIYPPTKIEKRSCLTFPKITIDPEIVHGTVTTTPSNEAIEGSIVVVNTAPESGYGVKSVSVIDEVGNPITVTNKHFIMPDKNVTVSVVFDVPEKECEDFEEYSSIATNDDFNNNAGVLPEGWSYIFSGSTTGTYAGSKPHLNKGMYSKDGVGIIITAGNTDCGKDNYLITPYVLHDHDTVSFNSYISSAGSPLYYGYIVDPTNKNSFVSLGQANNIVYSSTSNPPTESEGYNKFAANLASDGHYLAFRCYHNSSRYSVVIDNICIEAVPDTPSSPTTWVDAVTSQPAGYTVSANNDSIYISSAEGLAWLISVVNGLNNQNADNLSGKTVTLTADLDMNAHIWVPITGFAGIFNGNYHTISGLHIADAIEATAAGNPANTGLFGSTANGAMVKNLRVVDATFANSETGGTLGGIVGTNAGTVQNCYSDVALSGTATKGGLVGTNSGTLSHSYTMFTSGATGNNTGTVTNSYCKAETNNSPNTGEFTTAVPYAYGDYTTNNAVSNGTTTKPLVDWLNTSNPDATVKWIRPKGSLKINDGYPVLVEASSSGIMAVVGVTNDKNIYKGDANSMITDYGANSDADIYVYSNGTISSAPTNAHLFIDEHAAILHPNGMSATVGITIKNPYGNGAEDRDWHCFSTSLTNAPLGITYNNTSQIAQNASDETVYNAMTFNGNGYFPSNMNANKTGVDFYAFSEPQYHWINFKRNSNSHYYEDTGDTLVYNNESTLTPGKGYLLAIGDDTNNKETFLSTTGILNGNDNITIHVTANGAHLTGYNFLGNPYQSYLDFDVFASDTDNASALWGNGHSKGYNAYLVYDAGLDGFDEYLSAGGQSFSQGSARSASRYIHPHQGFFVVKKGTGTSSVKFTNAMRKTDNTYPTTFRDAQPNYPLVNLVCTDDNGKREISVIEFERPSMAGSLRMKNMLGAKGNMYIRWDGEDFGNVFLTGTPDYVPVWFKATETGVFTMTWSTANGDFSTLRLIDNLTGVNIDMLTTDSYSFEAKPSDSKARFRLVFSALGIEEEMTEYNGNFAFFNGNELVVNGEGELSLIDLNGRVLNMQHLSGQQSHIAMPKVASGMYMLRLANSERVRVQKIVIRK